MLWQGLVPCDVGIHAGGLLPQPQARGKANQIKAFLRALPCEAAAMVTCGTTLLKKEGVDAVVQAVNEYRTSPDTQHKVKVMQSVKITQVRAPLVCRCMCMQTQRPPCATGVYPH